MKIHSLQHEENQQMTAHPKEACQYTLRKVLQWPQHSKDKQKQQNVLRIQILLFADALVGS